MANLIFMCSLSSFLVYKHDDHERLNKRYFWVAVITNNPKGLKKKYYWLKIE